MFLLAFFAASFKYLCFGHYTYFTSFNSGTVFIRQNRTSLGFRINTVPAMKGLKPELYIYIFFKCLSRVRAQTRIGRFVALTYTEFEQV